MSAALLRYEVSGFFDQSVTMLDREGFRFNSTSRDWDLNYSEIDTVLLDENELSQYFLFPEEGKKPDNRLLRVVKCNQNNIMYEGLVEIPLKAKAVLFSGVNLLDIKGNCNMREEEDFIATCILDDRYKLKS